MLKKYPADYSNEVMTILTAMSFTNGKNVSLVGSFTLRPQVYAGDIDAYEFVPIKSIKNTVERFQDLVKRVVKIPFTYISDIKCGSIDEWNVISENVQVRNGKVDGYNAKDILDKVKELYDTNIIDNKDYSFAKSLIKERITPAEFIDLQKELRYNIIRWSLQDIIAGHKVLQDGRLYTLEQAIQSPTITKLDLVTWIGGNRFTDIEIIYIFKMGERIVNKGLGDFEGAVKSSILLLKTKKNYYKMAKRMYTIARFYDYKKDIKILSDLFVGDLGRLYSIYGDTDALLFLIENVHELPKDKIAFEVDYFITRLSNVSIPMYMDREKKIMTIVHRLANKKIYNYNNETMLRLLNSLKSELFEILSDYTIHYLKLHKLFPLSSKYLI